MESFPPWTAYALTCLLIELTPGPNMGFLFLVSASRGRRLGLLTVAGITLGLLVAGLLAAVGLAAIVQNSTIAYQGLRLGGGAYLLWLAWTQWREAGALTQSGVAEATVNTGAGGATYFRHGLMVNLLNPKAAMFYIAVLPTYIGVTGFSNTVGSATFLTAIYVGIATAIHLAIVLAGSRLQPTFARNIYKKSIARGLAMLLAVIAVWMVIKAAP